MSDLTAMAARLTDTINEQLEGDQISYVDLLDALASAGVTLTPDYGREASRAYVESVDLEAAWVES